MAFLQKLFVQGGKKHDNMKKQEQKYTSTTPANRKWLIVRNWNGRAYNKFHLKGLNIFQKVV